jgi:beta-glucosidase
MGLPENNISVFTGIKNEMPAGVKINYAKGCGILDTSRSGFDDAVKAVENSDVAILVVGESRKMSGEAASRATLCLPGVQEELVEKLTKIGKPVVVVLMNGRPLTIDWISKNVQAVLETWFLGCQGGNAIADVLFGRYNPSGKLTTTFPRSVGQIPLFYNHMNTGRPPKIDERYSSKYLDMPFTPLYPFGYGLSYTTFKFSNIKVVKKKINKNDSLKVLVDIKNTGSYAGTEIAQLYIRDLVADVTRPVKELKGFKRVFLNPGETKIITFTITPKLLEFYNIDMKKTIEPGKFNVMIGGNSDDVLTSSFEFVK